MDWASGRATGLLVTAGFADHLVNAGVADALASAGLVDGVASMKWFEVLGPESSLYVIDAETAHSYGPAFET